MLHLHPGERASDLNSKRRRLAVLLTQLKQQRQSFESHWKEIAELFRPRRIRLQVSDRNKGDKRNQKIADSTPVYAARTLAAGMMSGITSPARQWFKLAIADRALMEHGAVTVWLEEVREVMVAALNRSNFYETLATFYSDLGVFGTSAMIVEEDENKLLRCTHMTVGEYWIGLNATASVRVFAREFELTVRQIIEQFGERTGDGYSGKNLSDLVQNAWRAGQTETLVPVVHLIYENPDHDPSRLESTHKSFSSCYYEPTSKHEAFLLESGYDEWPIMAVRWEATAGDVYGTDSPGMTSLSDAKELMFATRVGSSALEKAVKPPMVAPTAMKNVAASILPGGVTYFDEIGDKKFRPAIDTSAFRLDWLNARVVDLRDQIDKAFLVDLFLAISQIDRGNVTATEVLEKKEEKLLTLGPVGKQIDGGFLDPFFDRLFGILFRAGRLPEPPPELEGVEFHPEYESIMAQAQRAQGRQGIDTFATFLQSTASSDPTVLDTVDATEMVKRYAEVTGVSPKFLRPDEEIDAIRTARAEAQAQQAAAAQTAMGAQSMKQLAGASTSGQNALTDLMSEGDSLGTLGGAPSPVGGL